MFEKVSPDLDFVKREVETVHFWKKHDIFEKSIKNREGARNSPSRRPAHGQRQAPHRPYRDPRHQGPHPPLPDHEGQARPRKAGWDTHGLPVELEVEKLLGLDGKEQIEQYGLEPFIASARRVSGSTRACGRISPNTVGFWADMDDPYVTYHDNYIESEWWALKQIWDKKLLYKGFKIVRTARAVELRFPHRRWRRDIRRSRSVRCGSFQGCWRGCRTSSHGPRRRGHFRSNVALCVNPEDTYCKVKAADGYTVL